MISVYLLDLPTTVRGFTKKTEDDYTIIINARMSDAMRKRTYKHELEHIEREDFNSDVPTGEIETVRHKNTPDKGKARGKEIMG